MTTFLDDHGRQRTTNFVAKKFEHLSKVSKELRKEKEKMKGHAIEGDNNSNSSAEKKEKASPEKEVSRKHYHGRL